MLFSICVVVVGMSTKRVPLHWDWRHTIFESRPFASTNIVYVCVFSVHSESRKTPILVAIKRSISIALKLAFSLHFSFCVTSFTCFCIAHLVRCCSSTKSSLHFWICTFVVSFCHRVYILFATENDNSVSVKFHFKQSSSSIS